MTSSLLFALPLISCDSNHQDYFKKTHFESPNDFYEAMRKYGEYDGDKYYLSLAQMKSAYQNESVKKFITSENFASLPQDVNVNSLWSYFYEDVFSDSNTYTFDTFVQLTMNKCLFQSKDAMNKDTYKFIGLFTQYAGKNKSVDYICENYGAKLVNTFINNNYPVDVGDWATLFNVSDTWKRNRSIACIYDNLSGYFPMMLHVSAWSYFNLEEAKTNAGVVIKERLDDQDSYEFSMISFYSSKGTPVTDGYFSGKVYAKVDYRARNSLGVYKKQTAWLDFEYDYMWYAWLGYTKPSDSNDFSFI